MEILIVEDDLHKYDDIVDIINKSPSEVKIVAFNNVRDTVIYLENNTPDKIVLDMSLPSHGTKVGEGAPLPMPVGGIEILLELESLGKELVPVLVLTQYPEIEIENEYFAVHNASLEFKEQYGIKNIVAAHYDENSDWRNQTIEFLRF